MPRTTRRRYGKWIFLILISIAAILGWREFQRQLRLHPERFPWTPLSLSDPVGRYTAMKLAALTGSPAQCAALRRQQGIPATFSPTISDRNGQCGYRDGLVIHLDGRAAFAPSLTASCPVANALWLWDKNIVQPAARRHLGSAVVRYSHFGSYSCRRLYGRDDGPFSEHATADAVDVSGFVLADGRTLSLRRDWSAGSASERAFLRAVRDGACDLFSTTLSPDYNAAHGDHLHLDLADRGSMGWTMCR